MPEVKSGVKRDRDSSERDASPSKKSKEETLQIRLLLDGKSCGAIIGKGGENITRIRKEYNVEVNMPATRTSDRVISLNGCVDDCICVIKDILPSCFSVPYTVGQSCTYEMNVLVHTEAVGTLIGKGGSKIKDIREESKGKMKVFQECLPNSNERVVAVGGDEEDYLIAALRMVFELLRDQPRRSTKEYDPSNKTVVMASRDSRMNSSALWNSRQNENVCANSPRLANGPAPLMGLKDSGLKSEFLKLQTTTSITVPNELVGSIIGKSGTRIKDIRSKSGAKIQLSEADKESKDDRVITMSGTQQQIQLAEQLMTECVRHRAT